jgi:hypothetical protein
LWLSLAETEQFLLRLTWPRSFAGAFRAFLPFGRSRNEPSQELDRIGAHCASDRDELDNVEASFTVFVFGNERLGSVQALGQDLLGKALLAPRGQEQRQKRGLFGRSDGLPHGPPSR